MNTDQKANLDAAVLALGQNLASAWSYFHLLRGIDQGRRQNPEVIERFGMPYDRAWRAVFDGFFAKVGTLLDNTKETYSLPNLVTLVRRYGSLGRSDSMRMRNLVSLLFLSAVRLTYAAQPEVFQFSSSDLGLDSAYANATTRFRWVAPDTYVSYFLLGDRTTAPKDRELTLYTRGHGRLIHCAVWNVATQLKHNAAVVAFENKTPNFDHSTTNPVNARIIFFTVPNIPAEASAKTPDTITGVFDFTAPEYSKDGAMAKLCDLTNSL